MKVRVIRIEKDLPLPEYKTEGAVAFDMYTRVAATIAPGETMMLPSNIIMEVPAGHALIIAARSSLGKKKGLQVINSIGIVDQDFHGPEDEMNMFLKNPTSEPVSVERGERLCQGVIVPIAKAEWDEVESIKEESRGGWGSTGKTN
jgi:dUTP pyrophosphatase